jgi:quinol monooxygenase YgiN
MQSQQEWGMSKRVYFVISFKINEGKLDSFKETAQAMIAGTQKEPGSLGYEWHFSDDRKRCRLLETYADQAAVQAHMAGKAAELIPKLLESSTVSSFEVYGDPGPEGAKILKGFGAEIFEYWQGLQR